MPLQGSLQIRLADYCSLLAASKVSPPDVLDLQDTLHTDAAWSRFSVSGQATPVKTTATASRQSLAHGLHVPTSSPSAIFQGRSPTLDSAQLHPTASCEADQQIGQDAWLTRWVTLNDGEVAIWDDKSAWHRNPSEANLVIPLCSYHCVKNAREEDRVWAVSIFRDGGSPSPSTWSPQSGRPSHRMPRSTTCGSLRGLFQRDATTAPTEDTIPNVPSPPLRPAVMTTRLTPDGDTLPPPLLAHAHNRGVSSSSAAPSKPWTKLTLRSRRLYKLVTGSSDLSAPTPHAPAASSGSERHCSSETDSSFASTGLNGGAHSSLNPSPMSRISPLPDSACTTPDTFVSKRAHRTSLPALPHSVTFRIQSAAIASQWASALSEHLVNLCEVPSVSAVTLQGQAETFSSLKSSWRSNTKRGLRQQKSLSSVALRDGLTSISPLALPVDASSPVTVFSDLSPSVPTSPILSAAKLDRSSVDSGFLTRVGIRSKRSKVDLASSGVDASSDNSTEQFFKRDRKGNGSQERVTYPPSSNRSHGRRDEMTSSSVTTARDSTSSRPSSSSGRESTLSPPHCDYPSANLAGGVVDRSGRRASSPLIFSALGQKDDRLAPPVQTVHSSASSEHSKMEMLDAELNTSSLESPDRSASRFALLRKTTKNSKTSAEAHGAAESLGLGLHIGGTAAGESDSASSEDHPRPLMHNHIGSQDSISMHRRESTSSIGAVGLRSSTSFLSLASKLTSLRNGPGAQHSVEASWDGKQAEDASAGDHPRAMSSGDIEDSYPMSPPGWLDTSTPVVASQSVSALTANAHSKGASTSDSGPVPPTFGSLSRKTWKTANRFAGAMGRITSPAPTSVALASSPSDRPARVRPATSTGHTQRPFSPIEATFSPPVVERILPPEEIISTLDRIRHLDPAAAAEARQQLASHNISDGTISHPSAQTSYPPSARHHSQKPQRPQTGPSERTTSFDGSFESLRSSRQGSFSISASDPRNGIVQLHPTQLDSTLDDAGHYNSLPAPPRMQKKPSAVGLRNFATEYDLRDLEGSTDAPRSGGSAARCALDGDWTPIVNRDLAFPSPTRSDGRKGGGTFNTSHQPPHCESPSERQGRGRVRALSLSDQWEVSSSRSDEGDVSACTEESAEEATLFGSFLSPDVIAHTAAAH